MAVKYQGGQAVQAAPIKQATRALLAQAQSNCFTARRELGILARYDPQMEALKASIRKAELALDEANAIIVGLK